ncbi:MAG: O-antigen ligase family protein [Actinobacteria bacterium]|nr:O-antigen ligase family protein [Actinomycetota bacterium]
MSVADRTGAHRSQQPLRAFGLIGLAWWVSVLLLGAGMDLGFGTGGRGPLGALVALGVGAPLAAAAVAMWPGRPSPRSPLTLALAGGIGGVVLSALSVVWAVDPAAAWRSTNRDAVVVCAILVGAALAWRRPGVDRPFAIAVSAGALPAAIWALVVHAAPSVGSDPVVGRLSLPVDYPNGMALVMACATPGILLLATERRSLVVALAAAAGTAFTVALVLTGSRSGIAVAVLAVALVCALSPGARAMAGMVLAVGVAAVPPLLFGLGDSGRRDADPAFAAALAGGMVLAAVLAPPLVRRARSVRVPGARRIAMAVAVAAALAPLAAIAANGSAIVSCERGAVSNRADRLTDVTANQRGAWWCEAAKGWSDAPVIGNGAGSFTVVERRHRQDDIDAFTTRDPHQVVLSRASDLGVLGVLALLAVATGLVWAVVRLRGGLPVASLAMVAAGVAQSQTDWTLAWSGVAIPVGVAAGILIATATPSQGGRRRTPEVGAVRFGTAVLVTGIVIGSAALPWLSDWASRASTQARLQGDLVTARSRAGLAGDLNPFSLTPFQQRALALIAQGDRQGAVDTYRRAVRRQPENPEAWRRLAILIPDPAEARVAWIQVHLLDPFDRQARLALAVPAEAPADTAALTPTVSAAALGARFVRGAVAIAGPVSPPR